MSGFWRSLEERSQQGTPARADSSHEPAERPAELGRRELMRLLGASAALAGAAACSSPRERIVPYTRRQEGLTPGVPLQYATTMTIDGHGFGLVVESHDGRPTKVEGNPEHPASLGATGPLEQASVLQLYDPDRARGVRKGGLPASFEQLAHELAQAPAAGLRLLLEPQSSPLVRSLLAQIAERRPGVKLTFDAPLARTRAHAGAALAFGRPLDAQCDFSAARVVLALDSDCLGSMPFSVRWARQFADQRRLPTPAAAMNRLYVAEPSWTPTGMLADERLRARAHDMLALGAALLRELHAAGLRAPGMPPELAALLERAAPPASHAAFIAAAAADLRAARGASLVIAGDRQSPELHALAHLANVALGNLGATLRFTAPVTLDTTLPTQSLAELAGELAAGEVETLVIVEGNPSYSAPAELDFARRLRRAPRTVHLALHANETSRECGWFAAAAHYLETWGDARAYDGTVSLQQPLIAPLFGGNSSSELLAALLGQPAASPHNLLREHWQRELGPTAFTELWESHLQRGVIPNTASPPEDAALQWPSLTRALTHALPPALAPAPAHAAPALELCFAPSAGVYDGRFGNNPWLQELPDPATKLTWDNAALISPATATRLELANEDVVELRANGRSLRAPILILPGHADDSLTLALGYGRSGTEGVARNTGVNAYPLRTTATARAVQPVTLTRTAQRHALALTQTHFTLHGRPIAFLTTLERYRADPGFMREQRRPLPTLMPERQRTGLQWAMTIDTSVCTGCSACVVACQAENNVPVTGKRGVLKSREMHWLRIDRYFTGDAADPQVVNQPMLCQHCEQAPCEYVCPVNATVHSPDGLNEMVYNRCIGTRFCSNNCPYKVRRFNFFDYNDEHLTQLQRNPSVTVRDRGVMEKCTFCVQRIRGADIRAQLEGRPELAAAVVTACQQACPTRAIAFGSLTDHERDVVKWRAQPRAYSVLRELNTRPRTRYLARITNPNPQAKRHG